MWVNPQFYTDMFTFTKQILNGKVNLFVHFFIHWLTQANRQKTAVKKITYFLKKYSASLFTLFEVFAICKFFTTRCLDVRFWDLLYFIFLTFSPHYRYLSVFHIVVIFNKRRENIFAVSSQNGKSCVCIKCLALVRARKLIAVNFTFLNSM